MSKPYKLFSLYKNNFFIKLDFNYFHTSKCRFFPRGNIRLDSDPFDFEEDDLYRDLEINNFGSSIGAKLWHSLPNETDDPNLCEGNPEDQNHSFDDYKSDKFDEMKRLLDEELKEKERIFNSKPRYLKLNDEVDDFNDERIPHSIGTIEKLQLSYQLSERNPSSKSNYTKRQLKEHRIYSNYTKSLEKTDTHFYSDKYVEEKSSNRKKKNLTIRTIRVLNIDKLPLEILHHMVAYNLVKHMPAERALRIIWRIASYRDKMGNVAYQNLLLDIGNMVPETCRAELVALMARAHQTISIPFLVDYTRNFGTFSRRYIAKSLEKSANPRLFDFIRFASFGGTKKLPLVLTQPRALLGYVNLLKDCSAKKYMLNNLKLLGLVPNSYKFEKYHAYGTLDERLADSLIQSERLLQDPELPEESYKSDDNKPPLYDLILKSQSLGIPIEDLLEDNLSTNPMISKHVKSYSGVDGPGVKTPVLTQVIPLVPDTSTIDSTKIINEDFAYKNIDDDIPIEGRRSWTLPWIMMDNSFIYKGKKYKLDENGWKIVENEAHLNRYKRSAREIRRRYSRKLKLKRMALRLSKNSNKF